MNSKSPSRYAYFRKGRRIALTTQREAAKAAGYDPVRWVNEDGEDETIHALVGTDQDGPPAMLRKGFWLGVYRLDLLADPKRKKGDRAPRKSLREITDRVRKLGAFIEEFSTGRKSSDPDEWHEMYADAIDRLAGDKKQKAGPGRPKMHIYSRDDLQLIEATWHRKDLKNPKERAAAVAALRDGNGDIRFPKFNVSAWYGLKTAKLVN